MRKDPLKPAACVIVVTKYSLTTVVSKSGSGRASRISKGDISERPTRDLHTGFLAQLVASEASDQHNRDVTMPDSFKRTTSAYIKDRSCANPGS